MQKLSHADILEQRHSISDMRQIQRFPFSVLLNNIRSMNNVGSIFRTADASCIESVYLTGYTACPPRDDINKTALGSTETVPWHYFKDPIDCIQFLKSIGYQIIALEHTTTSISLQQFEFKTNPKVCVILGNEVFGIDDELLKYVDDAVEIPMYGMKHSLNVSVAFGVCIYQLIDKLEQQK